MMPPAPSRAKSASDTWSGCRLSQALSRFPMNPWATESLHQVSPGSPEKMAHLLRAPPARSRVPLTR